MYDFTGKITHVSSIQTITGKFKEKCTFVVEDGDKKISFLLFDDEIYKVLKPLEIGDKVKVRFSVKSREFSGSWVTNCFALDVEKVTTRSKSKTYSYTKPPPRTTSYFPINCKKEEAKKIYRELCKKYRPDEPGGSHQKMQEINAAYQKFKR